MRWLGGAALACGLSFVFGMSVGSHPHTGASPTSINDKAAALVQALNSTGDPDLKAVTRTDATVLAAKVCAHPGDQAAQLAAILAPDDQIWSRRFLTAANAVNFVEQAVRNYC
jgi:hypothetical protein